MFCVISRVAPLAPAFEIVGGAVLRDMVKVCDGEDDFAARDRMRFAVSSTAIGIRRTAFAAVPRPLTNRAADTFPVAGID